MFEEYGRYGGVPFLINESLPTGWAIIISPSRVYAEEIGDINQLIERINLIAHLSTDHATIGSRTELAVHTNSFSADFIKRSVEQHISKFSNFNRGK